MLYGFQTLIQKHEIEKISEFRNQLQVAQQFIMGKAFIDREKREAVCLTTPNDVIEILNTSFWSRYSCGNTLYRTRCCAI